MAYLKRNNFGKFWPVPRKGTAYMAVSTHNRKDSIPLIIIMRDVLKLVKTKKELKKLINEKHIKINGKKIRETNYPLCLFDILYLGLLDKNYRLVLLKNKKYGLEEVSGKNAETKPYKILDKKILAGKAVQFNLMQGKNLILKENANIGDSLILDFENKVVNVISLGKGSNVAVIEGKHSGNNGQIEEVIDRGGKKLVKIKTEGENINVWIKNIIAIE